MRKKVLLFFVSLAIFAAPAVSYAAVPAGTVGRVLLQVQSAGEAWYVSPVTKTRVYLKDGAAAFALLRSDGLGITGRDLALIPVGIEDRYPDTDGDGDGIYDSIERALGVNPADQDSDDDGYLDGIELAKGYDALNAVSGARPAADMALTKRLAGRILLDVQRNGEAWYVHPATLKRYYMKNGAAAYAIMRYLGLGITNADLNLIPTAGAAASGVKDCGNDMGCFRAAAMNSCQPAKVTYNFTGVHPLLALAYPTLSSVNTERYFQILGKEGGDCVIYEKFVGGSMKYDQAQLDRILAENPEMEKESDYYLDTTNREYGNIAGNESTCKVTAQEFGDKIDKDAEGNFSFSVSVDFSTGETVNKDPYAAQCVGPLYQPSDSSYKTPAGVEWKPYQPTAADIAAVQNILTDVRQALLTDDKELLIKHATADYAKNISSVSSIKFDSFTVTSVKTAAPDIFAEAVATKDGTTDKAEFLFVKEGGVWKMDN